MHNDLRQLIRASVELMNNLTLTGWKPVEEFQVALRAAIAHENSLCEKGRSPSDAAYLKAAQENQIYGEIEVDDDAIISPGSDPGAYVQAWLWVTAEDAGVCDEPDCHTPLNDGEGFDGKCGNCADRIEHQEAERLAAERKAARKAKPKCKKPVTKSSSR